MKRLFFIFLLISNFSFAQNWSLFPVNDTLCYQKKSSNYISNTIIVNPDLINPAKFNISKSIYLCDTCTSVNNEEIYSLQSDFLFNHYSVESNQKIILFNNISDTAVLYLNKPLGYSWNFKGNITAIITSVRTANIFNTIDSIKTILLSNGDSLKVSKNFGLFLFKHSALGYLILVGDHTKKLGLNVIEYDKYQKVGVNDYLYFENYTFEGGWGFPCSLTESKLFKIKSIDYVPWGIVFYGSSYYTYSGYSNCQSGFYSTGNIINRNDQLYLDSLVFNPLPNSLINYSLLNVLFDTSQYNVLTYDKIGNTIRINAIPNYNNPLLKKFNMYNIGPNKFTHNKADYFDAWIETALPYFSFKFWDFEYEKRNYLSGYTINGQKFGTIDTNLILGVNSLKTLTASIYPQPNNGEFNIALNEAVITGNVSITILDLNGRVVFAKEFDEKNLLKVEANMLQNGVYILKINLGDSESYQKLIIGQNTSQ